MEAHYKGLTSHGFQRIIPKWIDRSAMIGRRISVNQNGSILTGTVKGVNEQGALLLDVDGTQTTLHAGDVTILGTNGR
jgi:BirA family biotin operon repressor/biotin-[acetyl-CoA-carboxylase] ligase